LKRVGGLAIGGWEDNTVPFHPAASFEFGRQLPPSNFALQADRGSCRRLPVLRRPSAR
jgi:hypothetical protein